MPISRAEEHAKRVSDWLYIDLRVPEFLSKRIAAISGAVIGFVSSDNTNSSAESLGTYIPTEPNSGAGNGYIVGMQVEIEHTITASDGGINPGGAYGGTIE